ncbi:hypothetical protein EOA34_06590 [Mesorhizobium sp. M4B.F.Ca.ET.013.02.1.1]|nr:hypothetical protein EOA34_06590 [Mesorhizobium sp. M4B.F.Ca.ET.013.02.1.1]
MIPSLKDFTDAMSASWPVALAACIGSAAVLVGEAFGLHYLSTLPDWLLGAAFLVCVFSGAVVAVAILRFLFSLPRKMLAARRRAKWKRKHVEELQFLPPQELHVLAWAAQCGTQVFTAPYNHQLLEPLIAKGYVQMIGGHHSIVNWPYRIPDHIWEQASNEFASWPPEEQEKQLAYPFQW